MKGKHNIKAWASLALSTVMVAAMLPLTVFAEDPVTKPDENKYGGIMNPSGFCVLHKNRYSRSNPDGRNRILPTVLLPLGSFSTEVHQMFSLLPCGS